MLPRLFSILCLILTIPACGQRDEPGVIHSEVDGVPLVRTVGAPGHEGPVFEVISDLVLGIDEGEPEWQQFFRTPSLLISPDGRMVLGDSGRSEFFIVTPEGELQSRGGGKGAGPGEFENFGFMNWADFGKEFWIQDQMLQRITRFSMEGQYLGVLNWAEQRREWAGTFWSLGDFRFLGMQRGSMRDDSMNRYAFIDSELNWVKDFIELPPQRMWTDDGRAYYATPFTSMAGVALFPDGRLLSYHPYLGRVTVYSPEGDPLLHIERDWEVLAVTAEEKARTLKRFREANETMRALADKTPFPATRASFNRAVIDGRGRIWIMQSRPVYEGDEVVGYLFDIFISDGSWIGTQQMDFIPYTVQGDFIYRTFAADSGAPRVERLRLVPLVEELK